MMVKTADQHGDECVWPFLWHLSQRWKEHWAFAHHNLGTNKSSAAWNSRFQNVIGLRKLVSEELIRSSCAALCWYIQSNLILIGYGSVVTKNWGIWLTFFENWSNHGSLWGKVPVNKEWLKILNSSERQLKTVFKNGVEIGSSSYITTQSCNDWSINNTFKKQNLKKFKTTSQLWDFATLTWL